MNFRSSFFRVGVLIAVAAAACLFVLFGIDAIASLPVRSALGHIDRSVSIGDLDFTSGILLLEDVRFPSRGISLEQTVIYWSGSLFDPQIDSILVHGGKWLRGCDEGSTGGSGGSRQLPPGRFDGFEIVSGLDTLTVSGIFSGRLPGDSLWLQLESGWGMLTGQVFHRSRNDSMDIVWFSCSRLPDGILTMPEMLEGFVLEGRARATVGDCISAEGVITGVDGESAEVYFEYDDSSGSPAVKLSSDLENVRDVLVAQAGIMLGDVYIDFAPSGYFTLDFMNCDTIGVSVDALLDSLSIYSSRLADDTVYSTASLKFDGTVCLGSWNVQIDSGLLKLGCLPVNFDLTGRFNDCPRISIRLWNDSLPGSDMTSCVPVELLGSLEGLQLGGEASFDVAVILDWEHPDSSDFHAQVDASDLSIVSSPISIGQLRNRGSCLMRDSWSGMRRIYLDTLDNSEFMLFDSLHPSFEGLLKCAEDATFRSHDGFCEYHIRNSIRANMASGEFTRGGSTITMQLARNLFLGREKTLSRKIQEVFLTWRLEAYLSKDRMLEIYANIVELGPNVFGFQEAAVYYFGRDFKSLSTRQVAYLVSILPGPRLYHRFYSNNSVPGYWEAYLDRLINISRNRGWIDPIAAEQALADSIVFRILD